MRQSQYMSLVPHTLSYTHTQVHKLTRTHTHLHTGQHIQYAKTHTLLATANTFPVVLLCYRAIRVQQLEKVTGANLLIMALFSSISQAFIVMVRGKTIAAASASIYALTYNFFLPIATLMNGKRRIFLLYFIQSPRTTITS